MPASIQQYEESGAEKRTVRFLSFSDKMKIGYHNFSDGTSFHGFTELYYASPIFKTFWFFVLITSIAVTSYQLKQAVSQFMNQSSSTSISAVPLSDIYYPSFKLCVPHWLGWFDWPKAHSMGFSREAILFAFSFISTIYTDKLLTDTEAKEQLLAGFSANNISTLSEFYRRVAKPASHFVNFQRDSESNLAVSDLYFAEDYSLSFCYELSGHHVQDYVKMHEYVSSDEQKSVIDRSNGKMNMRKKNRLIFSIKNAAHFVDLNAIASLITVDEFNAYMAIFYRGRFKQFPFQHEIFFQNLYITRLEQNYTSISIPLHFYADALSDDSLTIVPDVVEYSAHVKINIRRTRSTDDNPCVQSEISIISNYSCWESCRFAVDHSYDDAFLGCLMLDNAMRFNMDTLELLCPPNLILPLPLSKQLNENETVGQLPFLLSNFTSKLKNLVMNETTNNEMHEIMYRCRESCKIGCEVWSFDVDYKINQFHFSDLKKEWDTRVIVEYPPDGTVYYVTEIESQTWENFVGSVGGLIGIWLGASVVSFIQLFYLCCCSFNVSNSN